MAATDARPVPLKNTAFRWYFVILDADGDPVTGAASLDSEVSIDGGSFTDCTNEATEIGSTGTYYIDLTSGELNGDAIVVQVKTGTAGAKTTIGIFYPQEADDIRVSVTHFGGTAGTFSSGRPEVNATHWGGTAVGSATVRADLINVAGAAVSTSSAQIGVNVVNAGGTAWGSGAITAAVIATGAIDADAIASDAITAAKIASDAITAAKIAADAITAAKIADGAIDANTFASGAITAAAIAADAIGASELAADAGTEIATAVWAKTMTELASVPGVTASVLEALEWLFLLARNKVTQTSSTQTLRNDADDADVATAAVSDDGVTFTRAEWE